MSREEELRIHALGAAISRRDWHATEIAHAAIRDAFHAARPSVPPVPDAREEAFKSVVASLAAAISLLERGGKNAAPSNSMFDLMLRDYRKSLSNARSLLAAERQRLRAETGEA